MFWRARGLPVWSGVVENSKFESAPRTRERTVEGGISPALQHHKTRSISLCKAYQIVTRTWKGVIYLIRGGWPHLGCNIKYFHCETSFIGPTLTRVHQKRNQEDRKDFRFV